MADEPTASKTLGCNWRRALQTPSGPRNSSNQYGFRGPYKPLAGDDGASPAVMFARNAIKDHVLVDIEIQRANVLLTLRRLRMEGNIQKEFEARVSTGESSG